MSKFKVGDRVRSLDTCHNKNEDVKLTRGALYTVTHAEDDQRSGCLQVEDAYGTRGWRFPSHFEMAKAPLTKAQRAIAKKEAELAALKASAEKKAKQAAGRKAKAERAKIMRGLSAAGRRVVAMLQAGSAEDFGCQRESVIKLASAITGDDPEKIKKALP